VTIRTAYFSPDGQFASPHDGLNDACASCGFRATHRERVLAGFCEIQEKYVRVGWADSGSGQVVVCGVGESSNKRLNTLLRTLRTSYDTIITGSDQRAAENFDAERKWQAAFTRRLIHNLITYNAKSRQALGLVVHEDELVGHRDKRGLVHARIMSDTVTAADTFLKLLKNVALTSADMRTWRFILDEGAAQDLDLRSLGIHKLMSLGFHVFWHDFAEKDVVIEHGQSFVEVYVDYDTFTAALINIVGNAAKYTLPNSKISVRYSAAEAGITVELYMTSLLVHGDEQSKIWDPGYRGRETGIARVHGTGFGMGVTRRLLELNRARIEFVCGPSTVQRNGSRYGNNVVRLTVPRSR